MGVIGDTLSGARARRKVDLEQVHDATGIRVRYLEAIEQEDWNALPEEFYARSFVRKYAQFLDLDPEPLVAEYRRQRGTEDRGEAPTSPFARTTSRRADALRRRRKRQGAYAWIGIAVAVAVIVVAIVLIAKGGEEGGTKGGTNAAQGAQGKGGAKKGGKGAGGAHKGGAGAGANAAGAAKTSQGVKLEIEPTAEVWACVLNGKGKKLVAGEILATGETAGPFHSRSYTAAFGNGSIQVSVDGKPAKTPTSSSPIGIAVDSAGKVRELPEGSRPTCE